MKKGIILLSIFFILSACGGGSGGGSGSDTASQSGDNKPGTETPPSTDNNAFALSNNAAEYAYLNQMYTFKPELGSNDYSVTITKTPGWLTFNRETKTLTGTPQASDVPDALVNELVSVVFEKDGQSINYDWRLYYIAEKDLEYKYTGSRPGFSAADLKVLQQRAQDAETAGDNDLYIDRLLELNNTSALNVHRINVFDSTENADGIRVAVYDDGIYLSDPVSNAVVYRASVQADNIEDDSHGTRMTRYMLRYAPGVRFTDITVDYPLHIAADIVLTKSNTILSYSGGSSNVLGYEENRTSAFSKMIGQGMLISQSIGNLSNLKNDSSDQEIWFYNTKCNSTDFSGQKLKSYQFSNAVGFLGQLEGFQDIYNKSGALVKVQAVLLDYPSVLLNPEQLASVPRDEWQFSSIRAELGHAMHDGISVVENGNGATSQAAASFSAIVALLMEHAEKEKAALTARQLADIIFATADDIGVPGVDAKYGHGLVNAEAAANLISQIAKGSANVPVIERSPVRLKTEDFDVLPKLREQLSQQAQSKECPKQ